MAPFMLLPTLCESCSVTSPIFGVVKAVDLGGWKGHLSVVTLYVSLNADETRHLFAFVDLSLVFFGNPCSCLLLTF